MGPRNLALNVRKRRTLMGVRVNMDEDPTMALIRRRRKLG
jgi:hypothetical protein